MKPLGRKNYGSIPHLLDSKLGHHDKYIHKGQNDILTKKSRDKNDHIIVTEKYDGSNVGIARMNGKLVCLTRSGYLASSSPYEQHHMFKEWVDKERCRFQFLEEGERIVGEWLAQVHSLEYQLLHPFVSFDIFNPNNKRTSHGELVTRTTKTDVLTPRIILQGESSFPIEESLKILNIRTHYHSVICKEQPEGMVYRVERKGEFDFMAKWVRDDFEAGRYCIGIEKENLKWNYHNT